MLKHYFGNENNKAVMLKLMQDSRIVGGYNLFSSTDKTIQNTLALFSYGNIEKYKASGPDDYLRLGEPQLTQLRRLSVLQILQNYNEKGQTDVPYSAFPESTTENDELELQVAHLIGLGAIRATLSQRAKVVHLQEICIPRDVNPTTTSTVLLEPLHVLLGNMSVAQSKLEQTMQRVLAQQRKTEAKGCTLENKSSADQDCMDVDSTGPLRNKKRRSQQQSTNSTENISYEM